MSLVSPILRRAENGFIHWCPGCDEAHHVPVSGRVAWTFDGNVEAPTFSPSVCHRWGSYADPKWVDEDAGDSGICHYFIRAGKIAFCSDSTHHLAGQTVPMVPWPHQEA
jgi:hypothetical protein